jgi:hypothetical protein
MVQVVQQGEIVEAQHLDQAAGGTFLFGQVKPAVELSLRPTGRQLNAGNTVILQCRVVTLGDEGDLVAQVGQPVVDRRGREHQHPGFDPLLDDPAHQAVVARLGPLLGRLLVAEVVRLVDDDQVVVAPVHMSQVDVTRQPAVARQVGVVKDVVVEAVSSQHVAPVVRLVECPVVPQALRSQHQHTVVAQLVVLDDGQCFEGLSQAHAVRNDASAKAGQLVDGADDAIALELEKLLPDGRVADARGRVDDAVFVQRLISVAEQVMQDQCIHLEGCAMRRHVVERADQALGTIGMLPQRVPLLVKPACQHARLFGRLRGLDQVQGVAWRQSQPFGAERKRAHDDLRRFITGTGQYGGALRNSTMGAADLGLLRQPPSALSSQPASLQSVPLSTVAFATQELQLAVISGQDELNLPQAVQRLAEFAEGMQRKRGCDAAQPAAEHQMRQQQVDHAV